MLVIVYGLLSHFSMVARFGKLGQGMARKVKLCQGVSKCVNVRQGTQVKVFLSVEKHSMVLQSMLRSVKGSKNACYN